MLVVRVSRCYKINMYTAVGAKLRAGLTFLLLGVLSGFISLVAIDVPPFGLFVLPGLIYAVFVLMPWSSWQRLRQWTKVAVLFTSMNGYLFAAVATATLTDGMMRIEHWLVIMPMIGGVGFTITCIPLWLNASQRTRPTLLAATFLAVVLAPMFLWLFYGHHYSGGVGTRGSTLAFIAWQSLTACALGFAPPPPQPNSLLCTACQYNLHGNTTGQCPECGHAISPEQQRHIHKSATPVDKLA